MGSAVCMDPLKVAPVDVPPGSCGVLFVIVPFVIVLRRRCVRGVDRRAPSSVEGPTPWTRKGP